jgi:hypothetical protein
MRRPLAALLILLALTGLAHAFGLGLGNRFGKLGSFGGGGSVTPPTTGALLLEDGSSILLLEDGSSHFCLEGGC